MKKVVFCITALMFLSLFFFSFIRNTMKKEEGLSVIAYYSMRCLLDRISDVKEVASAVGAQYVITGDMQSQEDCVRINVQLINIDTNEQIWSEMYECKLSTSTMFDMQDNIVKQVSSSISDFYGFTKRKPIKKLVMAVA